MNKPKCILFNSPKGSGKTSIADLIERELIKTTYAENVWRMDFKDALYERTSSLFDVDERWFDDDANDTELKDTLSKKLYIGQEAFVNLQVITDGKTKLTADRHIEGTHYLKLTPREALIYTAECVLKPMYGQDFFGREFVRTLSYDFNQHVEYVIEAGTGFIEEVEPLIEAFGEENLLIIELYRKGHSCWGNDSRGPIKPVGVERWTITNKNNEPSHAVETILEIINNKWGVKNA